MTLAEFFGCTFLAFGPPLAMFVFTVAPDPVRIIVLIAAAFFWLLSLILSSLWWYIFVWLRNDLVFGVIFSVIFQEIFRYLIYKILRKTEDGLKKITDDTTQLIDNKHISAYVSGLGFGIMSGSFAMVNVAADSIGPGTMGLKSGTEMFFITSAATSLCFIMLHTFWGIIFFNALDNKSRTQLAYVVLSHLLVSCITLFNRYRVYAATLVPIYSMLLITIVIAFKVAGGSTASLKAWILFRNNQIFVFIIAYFLINLFFCTFLILFLPPKHTEDVC